MREIKFKRYETVHVLNSITYKHKPPLQAGFSSIPARIRNWPIRKEVMFSG